MNNLEDDKSNIFTTQKQVELALISWSLKKYSYKTYYRKARGRKDPSWKRYALERYFR